MNCGISNLPLPSCWECRFFEAHGLADRDGPLADECQSGDCRRHPPIIDLTNRDASVNYAVFPIVIACDWCGEFAPRRAPSTHRREAEANAAYVMAPQQHGASVSPVAGSPEQLHDHVARRSP